MALVAVTDHAVERYGQRVRGTLDPRTEIAARGFVNRLESVTGLDFRVAKLRSGAYQVAFAYRDPAEVDVRLAEIAAATGLDLSANQP